MTSQEKKQYLSQYLYICDEIEDLLRDLEEWYTIAGKVTASYKEPCDICGKYGYEIILKKGKRYGKADRPTTKENHRR